jgi:uncharacterized protein YegL
VTYLPTLADSIEFADNPEPRCPCVLLLDTSGSMSGARIAALNDGICVFQWEVARDSLAARRVEVAVVTFDSAVTVLQDFVTVDQFVPPTLTAGGATAMGGGVNRALDLVQARKATLKANGVAYYRPWVVLITDGEPQGEPTGEIERAIQRVQQEEAQKRVAFFAVGVEGANVAALGRLAARGPLRLAGLQFREMFVWLSQSMAAVAQSQLGAQVALPAVGWASV